jgi:hypothetical protein
LVGDEGILDGLRRSWQSVDFRPNIILDGTFRLERSTLLGIMSRVFRETVALLSKPFAHT